jgi:hypothetical protein
MGARIQEQEQPSPTRCGCVQRTNDALRETYPGVKVLVNVFNGRAAVATYRQSGRGKKPPALFGSYCTFCGVRYGD